MKQYVIWMVCIIWISVAQAEDFKPLVSFPDPIVSTTGLMDGVYVRLFEDGSGLFSTSSDISDYQKNWNVACKDEPGQPFKLCQITHGASAIYLTLKRWPAENNKITYEGQIGKSHRAGSDYEITIDGGEPIRANEKTHFEEKQVLAIIDALKSATKAITHHDKWPDKATTKTLGIAELKSFGPAYQYAEYALKRL